MAEPVTTVSTGEDAGVALLRRRARALARFLDLPAQGQARVAAAVALAARGGEAVELAVGDEPRRLVAVARRATPVPPAERAALGLVADDVREDAAAGRLELRWALDPRGFSPAPALLRAAVEQDDEPPPDPDLELAEALGAALDRERAVAALVDELEQRARDLQADAELQRRALRTLAHELRTPLYATRGIVEAVLADTPDLPEDVRADLGLMDRAAEEALGLVNDHLDLAALGAGRTRVHVGEVDLRDLLAGLRVVGGRLPRAPEVAYVVELDGPAPALRTDGPKLGQVLRNLVSNALKATTAGEVRVTARAEGGRVRVVVRDTGPGLTPEAAAAAFEEFGQVGGAREEAVMRGTGLGLPLARGLARVLGGDLTLESVPGEGAAFTVVVPAVHPGPSEGIEVVEA